MRVFVFAISCLMVVQALSVLKEKNYTEAVIQTLNYEDAFITVVTVDTNQPIVVPVGLIAAPRNTLKIGQHVKVEIFMIKDDKLGRNIIVIPDQ